MSAGRCGTGSGRCCGWGVPAGDRLAALVCPGHRKGSGASHEMAAVAIRRSGHLRAPRSVRCTRRLCALAADGGCRSDLAPLEGGTAALSARARARIGATMGAGRLATPHDLQSLAAGALRRRRIAGPAGARLLRRGPGAGGDRVCRPGRRKRYERRRLGDYPGSERGGGDPRGAGRDPGDCGSSHRCGQWLDRRDRGARRRGGRDGGERTGARLRKGLPRRATCAATRRR